MKVRVVNDMKFLDKDTAETKGRVTVLLVTEGAIEQYHEIEGLVLAAEQISGATFKEVVPAKIEDVAAALKASLPGLINTEAWPWLTMAEAAIRAMRK